MICPITEEECDCDDHAACPYDFEDEGPLTPCTILDDGFDDFQEDLDIERRLLDLSERLDNGGLHAR